MILNETNEPEQQQNGFYGPKTSSAGNSSLSHPFFLKISLLQNRSVATGLISNSTIQGQG